MKNLMEMRRALKAKIAEARGILNGAEGRALTEEEEQRYNTIMSEADGMRAEIEREERMQQMEMDGGSPIEQPAQSEHRFGEFLTRVRRNDPSLVERRGTPTGQNEAVDADGGYLIEPQVSNELIKLAQTQSVLAGRVKTTPISSNRLVEKLIDEDSREDGKRHGGILAYWMGEADQYIKSGMKFREMQTGLHKLTGLAYMTDELMQDVPALESVIRQQFADEFSFQIDEAILNGDGNGKPLGILAGGALVTVPAESTQAAGSILFENVIKMWNAMLPGNRTNAVWLVNLDVEMQLLQMYIATGTNSGVPVYLPPNGISGAPFGTLFGRPVIPIEHCAERGQEGDIVLCDLSQYKWIDRGGMTSDASIHVRFEYGETAFRFTYRAGGRPMWDRKIKPYKGATERSPYVTLAPRT